METKTVRVNKDVEFDVFLDGEHHKRVTNGLLITHDGRNMVCYGGKYGKVLMFQAMHCFTKYIIDNDLESEYVSYITSCLTNKTDI